MTILKTAARETIFTEALFEKGKVVFPKFLQSFMNVSPFQNCRLVKKNPITQMILREVLTVIDFQYQDKLNAPPPSPLPTPAPHP